MSGVYPEIEPYAHGMLAVGDANSVYWETCGNPRGLPAVVLHGGPGSGCSAWFRHLCDPSAYRIVLFDQRNCGRSTPHASDPRTDLSSNTTWNLVADIERLRQHLGISVLAQRFSDPAYRLAFTRIVTHYVRNYAHAADHPGLESELVRATDRFAQIEGRG